MFQLDRTLLLQRCRKYTRHCQLCPMSKLTMYNLMLNWPNKCYRWQTFRTLTWIKTTCCSYQLSQPNKPTFHQTSTKTATHGPYLPKYRRESQFLLSNQQPHKPSRILIVCILQRIMNCLKLIVLDTWLNIQSPQQHPVVPSSQWTPTTSKQINSNPSKSGTQSTINNS